MTKDNEHWMVQMARTVPERALEKAMQVVIASGADMLEELRPNGPIEKLREVTDATADALILLESRFAAHQRPAHPGVLVS